MPVHEYNVVNVMEMGHGRVGQYTIIGSNNVTHTMKRIINCYILIYSYNEVQYYNNKT